MNNIPRSAVEEDFWFLPRGLFVDVVSAPTERPWPRAEIWLAAGQHNPDNPDDPLVFELRLYGPRPGHGELILMTLVLPQEPELVVGNIARFRRWLRGARGGDYDFPVLEPDQARDFCDLARFMRVLSLPGQVQVPLAHWPDFYAILTGGFHLGTLGLTLGRADDPERRMLLLPPFIAPTRNLTLAHSRAVHAQRAAHIRRNAHLVGHSTHSAGRTEGESSRRKEGPEQRLFHRMNERDEQWDYAPAAPVPIPEEESAPNEDFASSPHGVGDTSLAAADLEHDIAPLATGNGRTAIRGPNARVKLISGTLLDLGIGTGKHW
ncbi:hypothetical protein C8Q76DRAFT_794574 [Earliella scabrosa]|nr:hypothetical protein C8Q76DRAFT_794574 [Earliella scabrosa]